MIWIAKAILGLLCFAVGVIVLIMCFVGFTTLRDVFKAKWAAKKGPGVYPPLFVVMNDDEASTGFSADIIEHARNGDHFLGVRHGIECYLDRHCVLPGGHLPAGFVPAEEGEK